jgi:hypothetical protein
MATRITVNTKVVQHDQWARSEPTTKAGMASCIGSDMSIVGNIGCKGTSTASSAESKAKSAPRISRSAMAHRSRQQSLRRT